MKPSIFTPREEYKPFEYPGVNKLVKMINDTYWVHSKLKFTADTHDFKTALTDIEREVVKRSLIAISQVEVAVKTFWGTIYNYFPKPELNGLGVTFAECEYRHSEAYSELLTTMGYEDAFKEAMKNEVFRNRYNIIRDNLNPNIDLHWKFLYFTLVIENGALFSQFANILSLNRFKGGSMKNVANVIAWTSIDEMIHAEGGYYLIDILQKEKPLSEDDKKDFIFAVRKYVEVESVLLDWIYEKGELDFFSKKDMLNFMYERINVSLNRIGLDKAFEVDQERLKKMDWFEEEIFSRSQADFFAIRPVDYTMFSSETKDDLF